jgi:hypothetical protein
VLRWGFHLLLVGNFHVTFEAMACKSACRGFVSVIETEHPQARENLDRYLQKTEQK